MDASNQVSRELSHDEKVQAAYMALCKAVIDRTEWMTSALDPRIAAIAKRLYRERFGVGEHANFLAMSGSTTHPLIAGAGLAVMGEFMPAWATYLSEAARAVLLVDQSEAETPF